MSSLEAILLRTGRVMDLKIVDDTVIHHFIINDRHVDYSILRHRDGLLARADAELQDLHENDVRIDRLVIQTRTHKFEILPGPNYTYRAYVSMI
jgi:hypothetical protein